MGAEYTLVDTRLLWLLIFLASGAVQYVLIGMVKAVVHWTRERRPQPAPPTILRLDDARKEKRQ